MLIKGEVVGVLGDGHLEVKYDDGETLDANLRIDREDGSLWNPTAGVAGLKVYIPHKHKMGTIVEANKGWYSVKIDDEDEPKKMRKASLHFGVDDLPQRPARYHTSSRD